MERAKLEGEVRERLQCELEVQSKQQLTEQHAQILAMSEALAVVEAEFDSKVVEMQTLQAENNSLRAKLQQRDPAPMLRPCKMNVGRGNFTTFTTQSMNNNRGQHTNMTVGMVC